MTRRYMDFTGFLDLHEQALVVRVLASDCRALYGGYPEAQRKILCVHEKGAYLDESLFPLVCVSYHYRTQDQLTHRDFLGALMAEQIRRDTIGDILVGEGVTQLFATPITAQIATSLCRIGRVGVKASTEEPFSMSLADHFATIEGTVASLRLDCIVHLAIRHARSECAERIVRGMVSHNDVIEDRPHTLCQEGDILSVRGFGKFRLTKLQGETRSGRVQVKIDKFL